MTVQTRVLLRWLGGKYRLAPKIIACFPPHDIYVEGYGGAGSVLFQKPRAHNEIWNDLDGELVNLMRVLRDRVQAAELMRLVSLTPYARREYLDAFQPCEEPIERARRTLIRSHMAHGTGGARMDRQSGFRSDGISGTTNVAGEWATFSDALQRIVERIAGVGLEQVPALELIDRYDDPKVLIYLDPPYVAETRSQRSKQSEGYHTYQHELTDDDHRELVDRIDRSSAMIALSGYRHPIYDDALGGWERRDFDARAHRNAPRIESLWLNRALVDRLGAGPLFDRTP